eukprot:SAG31_NODE_7036_length_1808_cov_1.629023_1_plen_161_part_00
MLNGYITALAYAARVAGKGVQACEFYCDGHGGPPNGDQSLYWRYYAHFAYLAKNVEELMVTGVPPYTVDRVLLTSGVLEAALTGRYDAAGKPPKITESPQMDLEGALVPTPWLAEVKYKSYTTLPWRPMKPRPSGAFLTEPQDRTPPSDPPLATLPRTNL